MMPALGKSPVMKDDRGLFFPLKLDGSWVQSNISVSKRWTFRGLHHQRGETAQTKQISVLTGSILDFLVDLRTGHFQEAYFFKLYPGDQILIPKGFAHGFLALEDDSMIQYVVDNPYSPSTEISFDWKSNETVKELILAEVGSADNLRMSEKDMAGVPITPIYAEDVAYYNKTNHSVQL